MAAILNLAAIGIGAIALRVILRRARARDQAPREPQPVTEEVDATGSEVEAHRPPDDSEADESGGHDAGGLIDTEDAAREVPPGSSIAAVATPARPEVASGAAGAGDPAAVATDDKEDPEEDPEADPEADLETDVCAEDRSAPSEPGSGDLDSASLRHVLFDRRAGLRVPFQSRARLQWEGHDVACETVNLDIQGVRCTLASPQGGATLPVGTPARITLTIDGVLLPMEARVTSTHSDGDQWRIGVRFDPLDDHLRAFLLAFVGKQ